MKTEEHFLEAVWSCAPILLPSLIDLSEKVEEDQEAREIDCEWRIRKLRKFTARTRKLGKMTENGSYEIDCFLFNFWKFNLCFCVFY